MDFIATRQRWEGALEQDLTKLCAISRTAKWHHHAQGCPEYHTGTMHKGEEMFSCLKLPRSTSLSNVRAECLWTIRSFGPEQQDQDSKATKISAQKIPQIKFDYSTAHSIGTAVVSVCPQLAVVYSSSRVWTSLPIIPLTSREKEWITSTLVRLELIKDEVSSEVVFMMLHSSSGRRMCNIYCVVQGLNMRAQRYMFSGGYNSERFLAE